MGNTLLQEGRADAAVDQLERAISHCGPELDLLYALGVAQQTAGRATTAIDTYQRCLSLQPGLPEIHNNLGTALDQAGKYPEAVAAFREALRLKPDYARPLVNLGKVLRFQGELDEAISALHAALTLSAENPLALTNLGLALSDSGCHLEAVRVLQRAVGCAPMLAEAHHGLGLAQLASGDMAAALASLSRAVDLKPDFIDAFLPLASALISQRRIAEGIDLMRRFLQARPGDCNALSETLNGCARACDWSGVQQALQQLRALPQGSSCTRPFLLLSVSDDPEELLRAARFQAQIAARGSLEHAPAVTWNHRKIRLAYVSCDFGAHATSFLIAELLELHDRSEFEVCGVSFGADDGSVLRARVMRSCDEFIEVGNLSDRQVAQRLREREIDIAVDLKGYTSFARAGVFAHRAAPVQVNWLGYPGTMGAEFIDYIVADDFVIPEAQARCYTESIAYLPDCYQPNDRLRRVGGRTPGRSELGLPEEGFVFCCFNNNWKITEPVFAVWMRLLATVDDSVLWLLADNAQAVENLRREATRLGIVPERLVFCGRIAPEDHLARHRVADLFLDTLPCNAHTTASDALWAGLPVVTCAGRTFAARVAGSLLRAVGMEELVTRSLEDYAQLAIRLAQEPTRLLALRGKLGTTPEQHPLFDTPVFCRHLEAAYRQMWRNTHEGRPPATFRVARCTTPVRNTSP